jgi:hypothetical protein
MTNIEENKELDEQEIQAKIQKYGFQVNSLTNEMSFGDKALL